MAEGRPSRSSRRRRVASLHFVCGAIEVTKGKSSKASNQHLLREMSQRPLGLSQSFRIAIGHASTFRNDHQMTGNSHSTQVNSTQKQSIVKIHSCKSTNLLNANQSLLSLCSPKKTFQPQAPSIAFLSSSFHHTFVRFYHRQKVRQKPRKQAVSTKLQMPGPTPISHRWPAEQHVGCLCSFQRSFLNSSQKIGFLIRSHPPQCLQKHCCHLPPQSALAHRPSCSAAAAA